MQRRRHTGKGNWSLVWEPDPETVAWLDSLAARNGQNKRPVAAVAVADPSHEQGDYTTHEEQWQQRQLEF